MERAIDAFILYLHNTKKASDNTEMSYRRDLNKFRKYLETQGIASVDQMEEENLQDYVLELERQSLKTATISRNVASIKAFCHYLYQENLIEGDCSANLHAPKVEKKLPGILTVEEVSSHRDSGDGADFPEAGGH